MGARAPLITALVPPLVIVMVKFADSRALWSIRKNRAENLDSNFAHDIYQH